ncbi:MAG TPA: sulfotransferase domain-containing protein [Acidimicrobiia bacterium]
MRALPTYIIAGAMRSGTTALNSYLRQHPEVGVSSNKETHFFDHNFDNGLDWYRDLFPEEGRFLAVGEATPNYMFSPPALDRIQQTLPEAKLVVMLRNPIDRAYSHYWHDRVRNKVSAEFDEVVQNEINGEGSPDAYLARGIYRPQIEEISRRFSSDSVLIQIFEEMASDPKIVYATVCRFIGVDDTFIPDGLGDPVNKYIEFRSLAARNWSRHLPGRVRNLIGRFNTKQEETYPEMDRATRTRLQEYFRDENRRLDELIELELPWDRRGLRP